MRVIFITPKLDFNTSGGSVFDIDLKASAFIRLGNEVKFVTAFSSLNSIPHSVPYEVIKEEIRNRTQLGISLGVYRLLKKYESETDFYHLDGHIFLYGAGLYKTLGGRVPIVSFFNRELIVFPQDIPSYEFGVPDPFMPKITAWRKFKKIIRFGIEKWIGCALANKMEISAFTSPILQKVYNDFGLKTRYELISPDLAGGIIQAKRIKRNFLRKPIRLICAGRLIPTKGFDLMLKAFSLLNNQNDFRLMLGGGGPDENRLKQLAREWKIERYVTFTGWLKHDELFPLFEKSDIFILPRWRKELTSVILMEAMSYGLPSIIPAGGGVDWQAKDAALTFQYDDPSSLVSVIQEAGANSGLLRELSENAYQQIKKLHYSTWVNPLYHLMKRLSSGYS